MVPEDNGLEDGRHRIEVWKYPPIETIKGMHGEFFANEKKLIEESHKEMEKMLSRLALLQGLGMGD